jgi:hypothetical protein
MLNEMNQNLIRDREMVGEWSGSTAEKGWWRFLDSLVKW